MTEARLDQGVVSGLIFVESHLPSAGIRVVSKNKNSKAFAGLQYPLGCPGTDTEQHVGRHGAGTQAVDKSVLVQQQVCIVCVREVYLDQIPQQRPGYAAIRAQVSHGSGIEIQRRSWQWLRWHRWHWRLKIGLAANV